MSRKVKQHVQVHTAVRSMCAKPCQDQENCLIQSQILLCLEKDATENVNENRNFYVGVTTCGSFFFFNDSPIVF